ncbi:MAG TPA: hypothetical protein VF707_14615 [Ardenticatenaceae bacterium]|jgi:hypothetical protein
MRAYIRLVIAFTVLLSAVALVPRASLGSGVVNWQRFRGAYLTPTETPTSTPTNTPTSTATATVTNTPSPTPTATATEGIPTVLRVNSIEAGGSASSIAWLPLLGVLALGVAAYWHRRRIR